MSLPASLRDRLRLPLIAAPMFLVSGPALVTAACRAGVVGSFPTANCRTVEELDAWLAGMADDAKRAADSEGLIDVIRAIRGVQVAVFFEELPDATSRVSMRSKDRRYDVCQIAAQFGGGGHSLAAGIRMHEPLDAAKPRVLAAIQRRIAEVQSDVIPPCGQF